MGNPEMFFLPAACLVPVTALFGYPYHYRYSS